MRRGRKNSLHDARSQQRRLYAERLHALDQPDAAGSCPDCRQRHAQDAGALKKREEQCPAAKKKQPGVAVISRSIQTGTFCPIDVGVRVGVNVSQRKTAGQMALTATRGQKERKNKKQDRFAPENCRA